MARGNKKGGYTLVEVMIFLAVASMMFFIAAQAINGRQSQAEFAVSVRELRAKLDDVLNDVSTGYYPVTGDNYSCQYSGAPGSAVTTGNGDSGQATHEDCIFLGKVVHFNVNAGQNVFSVLTVAGGRQTIKDGKLVSVQSLIDAKPKVINSIPPGLSVEESLDSGLVVTRVTVNGAPDPNAAAFGVIANFTKNSNGLVSGTISTDIVSIPGSKPSDHRGDTINNVVNLRSDPYVNNPTVAICVGQGLGAPDNRRAAIIIGSRNRQVTTEMHIGDFDTPAVRTLTGGSKCP